MLKVSEILRVKGDTLYTASPDMPVSQAVQTMSEQDIGSLVIMEFGTLTGMLTFREIIRHMHAHGGAGETTIRSIMDDAPVSVSPNTSADEVQRLAERTSGATRRIENLVQAIQADTNEAVTSREQTPAEVVSGARLAEDAGTALTEIERVSNALNTLIKNISIAAQQQSAAASDITRTMGVIRQITGQTSQGAGQTAESIGHLAQLAADLRRSVADFKLPAIRAAFARWRPERVHEQSARCDEPRGAGLGQARAGRDPAPGAQRGRVLRGRPRRCQPHAHLRRLPAPGAGHPAHGRAVRPGNGGRRA
ncbi:hypothetical protein G6F31_015356 [Rhizopus arrhizus]|nr:hypothetical protein G6F31_015356 [Rhizopus arrhizus]